jgi:hypothetical protein
LQVKLVAEVAMLAGIVAVAWKRSMLNVAPGGTFVGGAPDNATATVVV